MEGGGSDHRVTLVIKVEDTEDWKPKHGRR